MKALLLMTILIGMSAASAATSSNWKDCNLAENKEQCASEFKAREAFRKQQQDQLSGQALNKFICENRNGSPCGGGGGGAGM